MRVILTHDPTDLGEGLVFSHLSGSWGSMHHTDGIGATSCMRRYHMQFACQVSSEHGNALVCWGFCKTGNTCA